MTVDELLSSMDEQSYFNDPIMFEIDENLRTITVPPLGVVAGVVGDKDVNYINFQIVRYYNGIDLSEFDFRAEFINANNEASFYNIESTERVVGDDNILFTWLLSSLVTKYKGTVAFAITIQKSNDDGTVSQAFHTTVAYFNVLEGLDVSEYVPEEEKADIITQMTAWKDHVIVVNEDPTGVTRLAVRTSAEPKYQIYEKSEIDAIIKTLGKKAYVDGTTLTMS